jgi:hypothetical protein
MWLIQRTGESRLTLLLCAAMCEYWILAYYVCLTKIMLYFLNKKANWKTDVVYLYISFLIILDNALWSPWLRSWDSSVVQRSATGWMIDGSSPGRGCVFFSSLPRPERLWGPPSLLSNGYHRLLPWGKVAGAWTTHLHPVPRSRMRGPIPPLPNTPSWRGAQLKRRDNFTFTFSVGELYEAVECPSRKRHVFGWNKTWDCWGLGLISTAENLFEKRARECSLLCDMEISQMSEGAGGGAERCIPNPRVHIRGLAMSIWCWHRDGTDQNSINTSLGNRM